jgi:glycosyltransferase involved in cell wall biosynthesis
MERITLLMLTASLSLTGTHRILMDLIEGLDEEIFEILIAYKPEFPGPGNDLLPRIKELGFRIFPLRGGHLFNVKGLLDIHKIASKYRVDLIHCWDSLSIMARILGKLNGAKVIDSIGNPPVDIEWKEYAAKKISSLLLAGVVFQSKGSQELHHKHGPNSFRWCEEEIIYNSIDLHKIPHHDLKTKKKIKKKYGFKENDTILSNLGMYNVQKSQEHLIQACSTLQKHYNNIKLLLIGWGEREKFLRNQMQSLGLASHVVFTGKKQKNEVFELLAITDIYVSSSLWEGLPIAVLEAMAMGIPVIATNVVGNSEAVVDNVNGYLVPAKNPSALAEAIAGLIQNPESRMRMGEAGKKRVERVFDPKRFVLQHQEFYKKLLGRV